MKIDPRIRHLNSKQIDELIHRYYSGDAVSELIRDYKVPVSPSNLYRLFPPLELEEICPYCDEFMVAPYPPKSTFDGTLNQGKCPKCSHTNADGCPCSNCREIEDQNRRIALQQKKNELMQLLSLNQYEPAALGKLSFEHGVYLGALVRDGISEALDCIQPIVQFQPKFAPTLSLASEIVHALSREEAIIVIHPRSNPNSITDIEFERNSFRYYPLRVSWYPNVFDDARSSTELLNQLMNPPAMDHADRETAWKLWKKIALHECLEYYLYTIEQVFDVCPNIGEKTLLTFTDLLENFSVSQIYGIIYKSTNNALRFQAEKNVGRKYAINTIIGGCRSFAERALTNGWDLAHYNRIKELPQSTISRFLYERVLQVGDKGFYHRPDIGLIEYADGDRSGRTPLD